MPTVFIFCGLRFMFSSNDYEPIHIHVIKGKGEIKEYAIYQVVPNIVILENKGLKANELKMAEMVIEENKEIIIENRNRFFNKTNQGKQKLKRFGLTKNQYISKQTKEKSLIIQ